MATPTQLTPKQVRWTFTGLVLAMLLAALDQTIVATALPTIVGELDGLEHLAWVVTAYMLASTIALPLYGKAGDVIGRKPVFVFAIVVFLVGSILAGLAQDMTQLIVYRAIQGVGGGGLMIGAQAIIADIVAPRERAKYMGIIGGVFGLASVGGPLIGGFLTDQIDWRWVFYINIPLGVVALLTVIFALHAHTPTGPRKKVDVLGAALLALTSTAIILVTSWGGSTYAWSSPVILGLGAGAVVGVALFILVESLVEDPIVPLDLFRERNFVLPALVGLTTGIAMFIAISYLPTYLQMVNRVDATSSGLMMIPMTIGILISSVGTGRLIASTGRYKIYPILGTIVAIVGLVMLSFISATTSYWFTAAGMTVVGLGVGACMQNLTLIVQNSVAPAVLGTATSAQNYVRQIGASLGIAVFGAVFIGRLTSEMAGTTIELAPGSGELGLSSLTPEILSMLPPPVQDAIASAYAGAMPPVFLLAVPVLLVGLVLAFFIEERELAPRVARVDGPEAQPAVEPAS